MKRTNTWREWRKLEKRDTRRVKYGQEWKEDFLSAKISGVWVPVGVSEENKRGGWPKWSAAHALESNAKVKYAIPATSTIIDSHCRIDVEELASYSCYQRLDVNMQPNVSSTNLVLGATPGGHSTFWACKSCRDTQCYTDEIITTMLLSMDICNSRWIRLSV